MAWMHPDAIEYQRKRWNKRDDGRWTRPDAARWQKPDPERWLSPAELQAEHPELYERKYGSVLRIDERPTPSPTAPSTLDIIRSDETLRLRVLYLLRAAQVQVAMLRHELALRRKYRADQLRVLAGNPGAGQWTRESATVQTAAARSRARGHHYVPEGVFNKYGFPEETRAIFDNARTGPIPNPSANYFDQQHRTYNDAVDDLLQRYMKKNGITPETMTPDQARDVVRNVIGSREPRIQRLNTRIWNSIIRFGPIGRGTD